MGTRNQRSDKMVAKFVSLEWIQAKDLLATAEKDPSQGKTLLAATNYKKGGNHKRKFVNSKLILTVVDSDGKTYSTDIYSHVKYVKHKIRITKRVREQLEQYFKNYTFEVYRQEILGLYMAIRGAIT